jgi:hypothetical protein
VLGSGEELGLAHACLRMWATVLSQVL